MLLDIWVIFATVLLLLLAIGCAAGLAWRGRAAGKGRMELEARCEAARVALEEGSALLDARVATRDWKQELTARIDALDAEAAANATGPTPDMAVRRLVLSAELTGNALDLASHLNQSGGSDPAIVSELNALKAAHATLETELATLRSERSATELPAAATGNISRERELKSLVQQFTRDSREMLTCIQSLESENKELRAGLAGPAKSAA